MASKQQAPTEEPVTERVITSFTFPMEIADFVAVVQALLERHPSARLESDGGPKVDLVVPLRNADEEPAAIEHNRAQELLNEIISNEKFAGMVDVSEESGMLTTDEAADLRRVASEAETFLGFGG